MGKQDTLLGYQKCGRQLSHEEPSLTKPLSKNFQDFHLHLIKLSETSFHKTAHTGSDHDGQQVVGGPYTQVCVEEDCDKHGHPTEVLHNRPARHHEAAVAVPACVVCSREGRRKRFETEAPAARCAFVILISIQAQRVKGHQCPMSHTLFICSFSRNELSV
jgi:hypothetical protein